MAIRKNKKRIDPRYFLHETTYRDELEEGTLSELEGFTPTSFDTPPVETFFNRVLKGDFNAHFGRAGGGNITWNYDDARSAKDKSSTTMKGVAKTNAIARAMLPRGSGEFETKDMQKLKQVVDKFNQDTGNNLEVEVSLGRHDSRSDEQELFVTIS